MADSPTNPVTGKSPSQPTQIKVIAHSMLFYWWPVWFFGLVFSLWTYVDNHRLAIVGPNSQLVVTEVNNEKFYAITVDPTTRRVTEDAEKLEKVEPGKQVFVPKIRVSPRTWMAPLFFTILFLVILITNIPLRGLWSLVAIILIVVLALVFSLFDVWDGLLTALGDLHIFVNMAGYLAISVALLIAWVLAVYFFDRRSYMIFTPGQVKVCEEIGGREKVYDTTNLSLEKHRDDWFRHIILGFGTGDLTVKTAGADRHEIVLPNVAFIAFKITAIEQMMRTKQTTPEG